MHRAQRLPKFIPLALLLLAFVSRPAAAQRPAEVKLEKGDHIALIGNTLADRMQHDGWLETMLQARLPQHELVVRNLGFSGDELTLRLRSRDFGSPDQWLAKVQANVILAFFGYNESYAGEEGLAKFRADLTEMVRHSRQQRYDGQSEPRIVLVSPIAHEDLDNVNLPDGKANNARLQLYVTAMRDVAAQENAGFIDLFHPTIEAYPAAEPMTINGVHMNEAGNRFIGKVIADRLAPTREDADESRMQAVRTAVLDKNFHWFNRYRTTDGYSIYGGRADLKFVAGQTNREVMQRELEVLDVMTANRDRVIWAVAAGRTARVDDCNTPPFIDVVTNKPGELPGGEHCSSTRKTPSAR